MLEKLLKKIEKDKKKYGSRMQPPCSTKAMADLRRSAKIKLSYELPEGYIRFLSVCDGMDWDGIVVFASRNSMFVDEPHGEIEGLVEANERWRLDVPGSERYIFFGSDNDELLAYDTETKKFELLDEVGLGVFESYGGFEELLEAVLKPRFLKN